jgi:hypothetical protein
VLSTHITTRYGINVFFFFFFFCLKVYVISVTEVETSAA